MNFFEYIDSRSELLLFEAYQHASMVVQTIVVAAIIGILVGILTYRRPAWASMATTTVGVIFTIPSLAMVAILVTPFGLGVAPVVIALTLYALLPIVRNTIVGLRTVDPTLVDAARGIGMGPVRTLVRIQLPLAWPVILTGIRVAAQLAMGIGALAAFVNGPGLGEQIFTGLSRLGGANAANSVVAGTLGVVLLALILDAIFVLVRRLTTSRGVRV